MNTIGQGQARAGVLGLCRLYIDILTKSLPWRDKYGGHFASSLSMLPCSLEKDVGQETTKPRCLGPQLLFSCCVYTGGISGLFFSHPSHAHLREQILFYFKQSSCPHRLHNGLQVNSPRSVPLCFEFIFFLFQHSLQ